MQGGSNGNAKLVPLVSFVFKLATSNLMMLMLQY